MPEFVTLPSASLHCPICTEIYVNPIVTQRCGHSFCNACFTRVSAVNAHGCPLCRTLMQPHETQPNLALHSVIQELSVYCTHRANGCDAILTLETLDHHVLVDCKHKLSPCPNASLGCRYIGIPATLNEHHCVFDQMRVYIDAVNDRMTAMEDKIIRQNKELERLREFVRTSKTNPMLPMTTSVSPPASAEVVDENDEQSLPISTTWSLGPLECIKTIKSHTAGVTSLAHSPGFIYSGSHKGVINVHDEHLDQSTVQVSAHKSTIWSLAHDAHSDIIYSASSDKTIKVHSLVGEQPSLMATLTEHTGKIYSLLLNSTHLFSCSSDKTIKIWDSEHCVTSGGSLNTLIGHSGSVNGLACSNNGVLISASSDLHVKTWDVSTGQNLSTYFGDGSEVLDVSQSNTTGLIYASTYDASILCFDPRSSAEPVGTLVGHNWEVWQLESDDWAVFSGSFDHTIKRWDVRQMQCTITLRGHSGYVHALCIGDKNLLSGCADRTIKIWSTPLTA